MGDLKVGDRVIILDWFGKPYVGKIVGGKRAYWKIILDNQDEIYPYLTDEHEFTIPKSFVFRLTKLIELIYS